MSKVILNINYAGMQLQVAQNSNGEDVTPLKPISDLFGLQWNRQHKKVTNDAFYRSYLGTCMVPMYHAGGQKREFLCILLSRVSAYLMNISPAMVRAQGNNDAATFLEEKLNEWADALHDYEELGAAFNLSRLKNQEMALKQRRNLMAMIGTLNKTPGRSERTLLVQMIRSEAADMGISYQPDLIDQIK